MFFAGYEADLMIKQDTFLFVNAYRGVYRRSLNSTSWTKVGSLDTADLYASDYLNIGSSLYVSAGSGLYRSIDEGLTWSAVMDSLPLNWGTVDIEVFSDSLFLALYSRGVYKHALPEDPVSLSEVVSNTQSVNIYPNPVSDFFVIQSDEAKNGSFSIIDQGGKLLYCDDFTSGKRVDIPEFENGIYLVKVTVMEGTFDTKLIIAH